MSVCNFFVMVFWLVLVFAASMDSAFVSLGDGIRGWGAALA